MQAGIALELGELLQRGARLALFQRHVGFEHEPRHGETWHAGIRTGQQRLRAVELAHVDGGARGEQRRQSRRLRNRQRLFRELARLAVPSFE